MERVYRGVEGHEGDQTRPEDLMSYIMFNRLKNKSPRVVSWLQESNVNKR